MPSEQRIDCDELYNDSGVPLSDGEKVLVNREFVGNVRRDHRDRFYITGWAPEDVIYSLEIVDGDRPSGYIR